MERNIEIVGAVVIVIVILIAAYMLLSVPRSGNTTPPKTVGNTTSPITNTTIPKNNQTTTTNTTVQNSTGTQPQADYSYMTHAEAESLVPQNIATAVYTEYNVTVFSTPQEIATFVNDTASIYGPSINESNPSAITVTNYTRSVNGSMFFLQTIIVNTQAPKSLYSAALQESNDYAKKNVTLNGMTYSISSFNGTNRELLDLYGYKGNQVAIISYFANYTINSANLTAIVANDLNGR